MPPLSPLLDSLQKAIANRANENITIFCFDKPLPSHAPDFFSNDYLSLSADHSIGDSFLRRVQAAPPTRLLGSSGSRIATGNSLELNALETALKHFFGAPSALLFGSGFNANMAFLATVPQKNDVIIYDELVHTSCREGIRSSSCASYRFAHNSVVSFKECVLGVLQKHPEITLGTSTVFVVVESLYSLDGDFCPLTEIVGLVETLVPAGHAHIVVDEAHTSGICGPNGTGYVSHLDLNDRVHTKVHTFGKAWGFHGAIVLTPPIIRDYLINFSKNVIFSTSMSFTDIYALEACLGFISSPRGQELRQSLDRLCRYAHGRLSIALKNVPKTVLELNESDSAIPISDRSLISPVIPVFTSRVARLASYLQQRGHGALPATYPIVKKPRIRVIIHAGNTEEEIDSFIDELLAWAKGQERASPTGSGSGGAEVLHANARARL